MSAEPPSVWELRKGDTLLGRLVAYEWNFPWVYCHFEATAAFEPYRELFAEELVLGEYLDTDEEVAAWEACYEKITALGLSLLDVDGAQPIHEFLLHIDGGEAWFRS